MAGFMAPTQGLVMWNPISTAQVLGLAIDVVRDFDASGSLASTTGSIAAGANALTLGSPSDFRIGQGIVVQGAGAGGGPLVTTIIGGAGTAYLTLAAPAIAAVSGATVEHDDSWAWQAAIDAASGPCIIQCPPGSAMNIAATVQLSSEVVLALPASTLYWIGPAGGTIFSSSQAAPLVRSGIIGGCVDPGAAGQVIDLHSPQYCAFDLEVADGSDTLTVMRWAADAQATGPLNSTDAMGNLVQRLVAGTCGTLLDLAGQSGGAVTLNTFAYLEGRDCQVAGLVCEASGNVNTNTFLKANIVLTANNAIGVDLGQTDAAPNIANLIFVDLSIANPNGLTCTGLYLHSSTTVQVLSYSYSGFPTGSSVNGGKAVSYYIRDTGVGGPPAMQDATLGWSVTPLQIGPTGTPVKNHFSVLQTIQATPIPPQSGLSTSAQVSGTQPGDTVVATPVGMMPLGVVWSAAVLSDNAVALYFTNPTMAALAVPQTQWRFDVWQY